MMIGLEQMFTRPSRKSTFSPSFDQHHLTVTKKQFCFLFHVIFREQRPIESEPIESMMIATADDGNRHNDKQIDEISFCSPSLSTYK